MMHTNPPLAQKNKTPNTDPKPAEKENPVRRQTGKGGGGGWVDQDDTKHTDKQDNNTRKK